MASQISPPPGKASDVFDDWLLRFYQLVAGATPTLSHSSLAALAWTSSGHTGTASTVAGFNSSGVAVSLTESGTGNVAMTTSPVFTTPSLGVASGTSLALGGGTALATTNQTGTGKLVLDTSPTLVTPVIGAATGTSVVLTGAISSSSSSAGIGYATGAGGTVSQNTSKATGVTLSKICGSIQMNNAALGAGVKVSFTVTNTLVDNDDMVVVCIVNSGAATPNAYRAEVTDIGLSGGSFGITVENITAGSLSESVQINFMVFKSVKA